MPSDGRWSSATADGAFSLAYNGPHGCRSAHHQLIETTNMEAKQDKSNEAQGQLRQAEIEALEKTLKASEARVRELEEERRNAWSKARSVF